ncbi:MAG: hypothetical protein CXR30_08585 [Geobacter sp.]|nr:MAG: hypothetical protein CXR30_08585 [Geobacter sp.]
MNVSVAAQQLLLNETRALLTRINQVEPFALHIPMVPAAAIPLNAQVAIERHLSEVRRKLKVMVLAYLKWLESPEGKVAPPPVAQRKFSFLRLRFVAILNQLDIFADVLNQRSEHETGVWLSGLDVFAADALKLPGGYYEAPPVICFLERGPGAAIRRARTRLPGGDSNPVAVIQVPRERMVGSGVAASLVHEVGHQAAALLGLNESLRPVLQQKAQSTGGDKLAWSCWERWISEIIADLWAVAKLGVIATVGLMAVVSLPRTFVFRVDMEDPHPAPWIRVKLSCTMGDALYPHPQWEMLGRVWETFYPQQGLGKEQVDMFTLLEKNIPQLVSLILGHRPTSLRGKSLGEAIVSHDRQPLRLRSLWSSWRQTPQLMRQAPPALVFAVIGQAKADGAMGAGEESPVLAELLRYWALRVTLDTSAICARGSALQLGRRFITQYKV